MPKSSQFILCYVTRTSPPICQWLYKHTVLYSALYDERACRHSWPGTVFPMGLNSTQAPLWEPRLSPMIATCCGINTTRARTWKSALGQ